MSFREVEHPLWEGIEIFCCKWLLRGLWRSGRDNVMHVEMGRPR